MSPSIPSPTPIQGVQNPDGSQAPPGPRLPLAELQQNDFAFALYVQALLAWQQDGDEAKDSDSNTATSYFQVTGVHGIPYVPWQNDPTQNVLDNVGYCTHRSVLFVPWHRPYLMLYEQIIYQYALEIVEKSTGYARQAYQDVLQYVRLPYWDFSRDVTLPTAVKNPTLDITVPGDAEGETKTITLQQNPFYSYKFTSDYAWDLIVEELGWAKRQPDHWIRESKRCPDDNGVSHPEVADAQLQTVKNDFRNRAYSLLTSSHDFVEFTCQAAQTEPGKNYDAVENWHNFVHNYTGTNDPYAQKYPWGNLTDVQASSFDPVFWLLHTHVDRVTAIWQAMNYNNITIRPYKSRNDRATAKEGTMESGDSHLEPWHMSAKHTMDDYWIADSTKMLESTFTGGYYYPETPLQLRNDNDAMQRYAIQQVNALYAPFSVRTLMSKSAKARLADTAADETVTSEESHLEEAPPDAAKLQNPTDVVSLSSNNPQPITSVEWRAFVRVKAFAVKGSWGIHFFFGEPPADSQDWFMSNKRVGTANVLNNESLNACANCATQAASGLLVTGLVLLSDELEERNIDIFDEDAVVKFLKDNLTWRIAKDSQNVEITPEMSLIVGVSARQVAYPMSPSQLPEWGPVKIYPDATAGKDGGLEENIEEL